jgi:hypothetical protein
MRGPPCQHGGRNVVSWSARTADLVGAMWRASDLVRKPTRIRGRPRAATGGRERGAARACTRTGRTRRGPRACTSRPSTCPSRTTRAGGHTCTGAQGSTRAGGTARSSPPTGAAGRRTARYRTRRSARGKWYLGNRVDGRHGRQVRGPWGNLPDNPAELYQEKIMR